MRFLVDFTLFFPLLALFHKRHIQRASKICPRSDRGFAAVALLDHGADLCVPLCCVCSRLGGTWLRMVGVFCGLRHFNIFQETQSDRRVWKDYFPFGEVPSPLLMTVERGYCSRRSRNIFKPLGSKPCSGLLAHAACGRIVGHTYICVYIHIMYACYCAFLADELQRSLPISITVLPKAESALL